LPPFSDCLRNRCDNKRMKKAETVLQRIDRLGYKPTRLYLAIPLVRKAEFSADMGRKKRSDGVSASASCKAQISLAGFPKFCRGEQRNAKSFRVLSNSTSDILASWLRNASTSNTESLARLLRSAHAIRRSLTGRRNYFHRAFTAPPSEKWLHMHLAPTSLDTTSVAEAEGSSPVHSAQLRSHVTLPRGLSWDASVYFVDRLADPSVPWYTRVDTQLTW
jgi:hypothetical protein